jgi:hypothetical protein
MQFWRMRHTGASPDGRSAIDCRHRDISLHLQYSQQLHKPPANYDRNRRISKYNDDERRYKVKDNG